MRTGTFLIVSDLLFFVDIEKLSFCKLYLRFPSCLLRLTQLTTLAKRACGYIHGHEPCLTMQLHRLLYLTTLTLRIVQDSKMALASFLDDAYTAYC